jgi:ribosome-binding factor A
MKPFSRSERVSGHIQKALSDLLRRGISDPRLEGATITGVKMNRDLRIATIYFSIHGGEEKKRAAIQGFNSAKGFVKRGLAGELGLRYMPDLRFHYDDSFDYGARIDELLKSIETTDHAKDSKPSQDQ